MVHIQSKQEETVEGQAEPCSLFGDGDKPNGLVGLPVFRWEAAAGPVGDVLKRYEAEDIAPKVLTCWSCQGGSVGGSLGPM